jgi:hypothetical protein
MTESSNQRGTRREVIAFGAGGLAAAALAALRNPSSARAFMAVQGAGGITGGGEVTTGAGAGEFILFGSRFEMSELDEPLFFGVFELKNENGPLLQSTSITAYGPVKGSEETTREMSGLLTVDGEGSYPFTLVAVDQAGIEKKDDHLTLTVDLTGSELEAGSLDLEEAKVTRGDVQLLTFKFPVS